MEAQDRDLEEPWGDDHDYLFAAMNLGNALVALQLVVTVDAALLAGDRRVDRLASVARAPLEASSGATHVLP